MQIAFVGMTHLGLVSAIGAVAKGHTVVCYDPNPDIILQLQNGHIAFVEPSLEQTLHAHRHHICFSSDPKQLQNCSLVYVAPDIPTNGAGESDSRILLDLLDHVFAILNPEAIVVVHSQVAPGFCRQLKWPSLFYHVETLIFGRALQRALYPERLIIGKKTSQQALPQILADYLASYQCPILQMNYESAELTKIAINLFLISSVSTTNTIAGLCEKIGARWEEISSALKLDERIGKQAYLSPGMGISGGNLERDMTTFCQLADQQGVDCSLVRTWQKLSKKNALWVLKQLQKKAILSKPDATIAMLGLAYKKDTSSTKNSPALLLLEHLSRHKIQAYDPVVKTLSHPKGKLMPTAYDAACNADVLIVMTPWDEFTQLSAAQIKQKMAGRWVIDPYGILPAEIRDANYLKLGE